MKIVTTPNHLRQTLGEQREQRIALVPTMGCLHEGHLSLIRQARSVADIVVVSIYVNPLQFGPGEDLDRYPRPFERDAALCEREGVDLLFHPPTLYPADGAAITLTLRAGALADSLCGAARPGHFDGVLTVVNILFNLVQPDLAMFGEKDWQQLTVIRRMVRDLNMAIEIVAAPTVREADGLAMSSRNTYLNAAEREQALTLSRALRRMAARAEGGEDCCDRLIAAGASIFADARLTPEYLEIRHAETLAPLERIDNQPARAFVACRIGATRLIDNCPLKE